MATVLSAVLITGAVAQQAQPDQDGPATTLEDVEVTTAATRAAVQRQVEAFVESNMAPPRGRPLAQWSKPVCIGAAQLTPAYAQAIIDRIATRIIEIGGDVAEPGCRVDIMVVGTNDGAAMAQALVEADPRGYRPARGSTDRGAASLEAFQKGDAPVRWWHVSMPVNVDTGQIAMRLDGEDPPVMAVRQVSHLRTNVREDLKRVVIIIDFAKMPADVRLTALVDYAAFVALAQVNPEGDPSGQQTILNLFNQPTAYDGLTAWDLEYLAALYRSDSSLKGVGAQNRSITGEVLRQRRQD